MPNSPPRRRVSWGGFNTSYCCTRLYLLGLCFVGAAVALWLLANYTHFQTSSNDREQARRLSTGADLLRSSRNVIRKRGRPVKRAQIVERFATLYHSELTQQFGFAKNATASVTPELVAALQKLESMGITTVIFSSPWDWLQPSEGPIRFSDVDALVNATCQATKLKIAFILDLLRAPEWVFNKWPDAQAVDSHWVSYRLLSWFHPAANRLAVDVLTEVVMHLVSTFPGRVTAVQPVYNNEYEARYTQENDCFQDYSRPAIAAFQQWMEARIPALEHLNRRWGTNFSGWQVVVPPILEAGSFMGPDLQPRYWDFIRFREQHGAQLLNRACAAVQSTGARCFHHVPELFTVLDAVYGSTMFKQIAVSPNTDFLVVSSDFRTTSGSIVSSSKAWLGVAVAAAYGKQVFFEAAVEHAPPLDTLAGAMRLALAAGAEGLGLSNWLGRFEPGPQLQPALQPTLPGRKISQCVGVFIHLDSCSAFHGLQWDWFRKDPVHDLAQEVADLLVDRSDWSVSVFVELGRLQEALPSLDRVVFLEPLVLLGDEQLELYTRVKEAIKAMPHTVLQLPFNQTRGIRTAVMPSI